MNHIVQLALLTAGLVLAGFVRLTPMMAGEPEGTHWREAVNCGPNSLYLLLRSNDWHGSLAEVRSHFPQLDSRGCSLEDIRRAAAALNEPVDVVRTSLPDLVSSGNLPSIVHLDNPGLPVGHFVLLVDEETNSRTGNKEVRYIDPIDLNTVSVPSADFVRKWSTYAIVRRSPPASWTGAEIMLMCLDVLLLGATLHFSWKFLRAKSMFNHRSRNCVPCAGVSRIT
jgi:Peptidase C39 family